MRTVLHRVTVKCDGKVFDVLVHSEAPDTAMDDVRRWSIADVRRWSHEEVRKHVTEADKP
jgi:hypothetical protein